MEVSVWPSSAFHNFDHLKTFYVFPTLQRPTRSSQIKMQAKFASSYHRSARTTKTTFFWKLTSRGSLLRLLLFWPFYNNGLGKGQVWKVRNFWRRYCGCTVLDNYFYLIFIFIRFKKINHILDMNISVYI